MENLSIEPKPYLLINEIQNYAWGTRNKNAFIPRLLGLEPEQDKPYAELWMGAHPKAPSRVKIANKVIPLDLLVKSFPVEILGKKLFEKYGELPFLFKVLSAAEALSIQSHPTKEQAEELHKRDPQNYPDSNHKPEIAVALDKLTALVGFKKYKELMEILYKYPEINDFVGYTLKTPGDSDSVKQFYFAYIQKAINQPDDLSRSINALRDRLTESDTLSDAEKLFLKMREKYSGPDVGLFTIFFLNLLHLYAGEAIFLKAGIPHAYICGNIVECMANSDNVVRAGLTPKYQDVETLLKISDYTSRPVVQKKNSEVFTFKSDTSEFQITEILLTEFDTFINKSEGVRVLFVVSGSGKITWGNGRSFLEISKGEAYLVPDILESFKITTVKSATLFCVDVP